MRWRATRNSQGALVLLAALALCALAIAESVKTRQIQPYVEEKLVAAQKMKQAVEAVAQARKDAGYLFDPRKDPRQTGLIGEEFTPVTTDRGTLEAKQIVCNPNFAALLVDLYKTAGLQKGDTIAVGWTGSLPGANIAVLAAAGAMGLDTIAISSVTSSTYGANDPQFVWLDIEKLLVEKGIFKSRSVAASLGGDEDLGKGLGRAGRRLIEDAIKRTGVSKIHEASFEAQVAKRLSLYSEHARGEPIKMYINVGGGMASVGGRVNIHIMRPGLNTSVWGLRFGKDGVMTIMAKRRVPIIHINYINEICRRYGFPTDPMASDTPGDNSMYYRDQHVPALVAGLSIGLVVIFIVVLRIDMRHYIRRRRAIYSLPEENADLT